MERDGQDYASDGAIDIAFGVIGLIVLALIGWEIWRAWDTTTAATYAIRKDQWTCTQSRQFHSIIMDGRYGRVHDYVRTVCDQYSRSSAPPRSDRLP